MDGAESITVKLLGGPSFVAEIVSSDPLIDVALLKIAPVTDLTAINFGVSAEIRAGDEVFAVGNPFGLGGFVTSGIISATSRNIHSGPFDDYIQTDAAINKGNLCGPLFNTEGNVIEMNTATFSHGGGSLGIGFAVPSNIVKDIVSDLSDDGQIARGWLGVQIRPISDEIASVLGYDSPKGALVEMVTKGSPA